MADPSKKLSFRNTSVKVDAVNAPVTFEDWPWRVTVEALDPAATPIVLDISGGPAYGTIPGWGPQGRTDQHGSEGGGAEREAGSGGEGGDRGGR